MEKSKVPEILQKRFRIDCYLAKLKAYRQDPANAAAHFEVITREVYGEYGEHVLSPSRKLLYRAKGSNMPFEQYILLFRREMEDNPAALDKIRDLASIGLNGQTVFLVCMEKNAEKCHRSIVKQMIIEHIAVCINRVKI